MSKLGKRTARRVADNVPVASRYLAEKRRMHEQLAEQTAALKTAEERNRQLEHKVGYLRNRVVPHIRFITHQLDATGAPLIFIDMVKDFIRKYPDQPVDFQTFHPANRHYINELRSVGLDPVVHEAKNRGLDFVEGDVIVLNTAAHTKEVKGSVYEALESGVAKKLIWFIHEDWPHVFFSRDERNRVKALMATEKLVIFLPSTKVLKNHQKFFGDDAHIKQQLNRVDIDKKYRQNLKGPNFDKLTFIMVGKTGEGIKGHLPILYAFLAFKNQYYDKNPELYRDFELRFIGMEGDYLSLQILNHSSQLAGHFRSYPPLSHDQALETIKNSNITICYSMRECLPIYVFEGMAAGHPILRNDTGGREEQLIEGKNGYLLDDKNYLQVVSTVEKILNKKAVTNKQLAEMSAASHNIAVQQSRVTYRPIISEIWGAFNS